MNWQKSYIKRTIFLSAFALLETVFGQSALQKEPSEVTNLRNSWLRAREQALRPIDTKYISALEEIKDRFTKAGNLDAALSADAELKLVAAQIDSRTNSAQRETPSDELRKYLISTSFKLYYDPPKFKEITFLPDGMIGKGGNEHEHSWVIENDELQIFKDDKTLQLAFRFHGVGNSLTTSRKPPQKPQNGSKSDLEPIK